MPHAGAVRRAAMLALALSATAPSARANGRFPQANYLMLGPGPRSDLIVLRTTFGIVLSRDLGQRWEWVCEEALDAVGSFDPSIALSGGGAITLGLPTGMRRASADGCRWTVPPGALGSVTDVTHDAQGAVLYAAGSLYDASAPYTVVVRSDDGGASWRRTAQIDSYIVETIDVAPGDARRVYLSGYRPGAVGTILRSDDGGAMFRATAATFPSLASVWIAGVDPTRPDRLWLRVAAGLGTQLHRSDDGGEHAAMIAATVEPMDGFAVSDDGETVWYGTANRTTGILRSRGGGPFERIAATATVRCMRFHGGVLFVCGDEATDGYSLAWSRDGGDHLNPLMSVRDITGPLPGCTGDGSVTPVCGPVWTQLAPQLRDLDAAAAPPRVPLAPADAGLDAPAMDVPAMDVPATDVPAMDVPAMDVPAMDIVDATASPDAPPRDLSVATDVVTTRDAGAAPPTRKDCDCHVPARRGGSAWPLLALLALLRFRRR